MIHLLARLIIIAVICTVSSFSMARSYPQPQSQSSSEMDDSGPILDQKDRGLATDEQEPDQDMSSMMPEADE